MVTSPVEVVGDGVVFKKLGPQLFITRTALSNLRYFFAGETCVGIPAGKGVVCFACIL